MEIFIGIQDIVDVEPNQDHQRAQFRPQRKLQLPFLQLNLVLSFLKKKIHSHPHAVIARYF